MIQETRDALEVLLGLSRDAGEITTSQMALRAAVIYVGTLIVVRLGSKRFLGKATAFDVILGIIIGSVMSRGINGSAGLVPTLVGGAVLVALHWLLAALSYRTGWVGNLVKGKPRVLIEDGHVRVESMRKSSLSESDLDEALRLKGLPADPSRVRLARLERNGDISVLPCGKEHQVVEISVADGVQTIRIELGG